MKQLIKKYRSWLLIVQLLCVMLLMLYAGASSLKPLMGSVYAFIGVRALAATDVDFPDAALIVKTRRNFEWAYSAGWSPADPGTDLRLAQALMLQGNAEFAVTTLELAYQANLTAPEINQATIVTRMVEFGDHNLDHRQSASALQWYRLAIERLPALQPTLSFRRALAAIFAKDPSIVQLLADAQQVDPTFALYPLTDTLKISGPNFRWMTSITSDFTYGTPLADPLHGDSIGTLWWSGEALAVVQTEHAGQYLMSARVRHSAPPPVQMALGADRQQLATVNLTRGDNSWETVSVPLTLSPGLHTINIWFLNNGVVGDLDRDAAIEWVMLQTEP